MNIRIYGRFSLFLILILICYTLSIPAMQITPVFSNTSNTSLKTYESKIIGPKLQYPSYLNVETSTNSQNVVVRENKNNKTITNYGLMSGSFVLRLWTRFIRRIFTLNRYGILWIGIATGLIIFWHIPALFDFASENREIHVLRHISFIAIGATSLLAIRSLGENSTIFLLFSMAGMMAFTGLVFVILTERIYLFYNISEHNQAGTYMIISSIVLLLGIFPAYIIKRTLSFVKISD